MDYSDREMHASRRKSDIRPGPRVNRKLVSDHEKLMKELQRLGVDTKTRYTLGIPVDHKDRRPGLLVTGLGSGSRRIT